MEKTRTEKSVYLAFSFFGGLTRYSLWFCVSLNRPSLGCV